MFIFGNIPKGNLKASEDVNAIGLELMKVNISNVKIVFDPRNLPPKYSYYKLNFAASVKANLDQCRIDLSRDVFFQCTHLKNQDIAFPMELPVFSTLFKRIPDSLKSALTEMNSRQIEVDRNDTIFIFEELTLEQLYTLLDCGLLESPRQPPRNTIAVSDYTVYITLMRLLAGAVSTHRYAVYNFMDEFDEVSDSDSDKGDIGTSSRDDNLETSALISDSNKRKRKQRFSVELSTIVRSQESVEKGWYDISEINDSNSYISMNFVKELQKPSHDCIGAFLDMIEANLGPDMETVLKQKSVFRKFLITFEFTVEGAILEHICKCFLSGINSGCRAIPVFSRHIYCGCILEGSCEFTVDNKKYVPHRNISSDIGKFCNNTSKLLEINVLAGVNASNVSSMRELYVLLKNTILSNGVKDDIMRISAYLVFPQRCLVNSYTNVLSVYRQIGNYTDDISNDLFLHHSALFSSRTVSLLSAFGSSCPTFSLPQGKALLIDKKYTELEGWRMAYRMVTYSRAELDIAEWVSDHRVRLYTKTITKKSLETAIPISKQKELYDILRNVAQIVIVDQVKEEARAVEKPAQNSIFER